jgi:hypothetical protein
MAVTSKNMRATGRPSSVAVFAAQLRALVYGTTLLLAVLAIYAVVGVVQSRVNVFVDDVRYGRPRTHHITAFVGHGEESGRPTQLTALNLDREIVILELPGGDASKVRAISGPYLFGADEHLTPVTLAVQDIDGDGQADLLVNIRREQIVYLNKDGAFRLPDAAEQQRLMQAATP